MAQTELDLPNAIIFGDALPIVDQRVAMIGNMLRDELKGKSEAKMSTMHLDSLFNILAIHLLRQYGLAKRPKVFGGLTDRQLKTIQKYMHAHMA